MVRSTAEAKYVAPDRARITFAPRYNSKPTVEATNTHRIRHTHEHISRKPNTRAITPAINPIPSGHPKFRFRLSVEVFRHASSGPTPVKNRSNNPMGIFTLLKKGAPTLMRLPVIHSEKTGKSVPERIATQDTRRIRLLNRKLDSRETIESS